MTAALSDHLGPIGAIVAVVVVGIVVALHLLTRRRWRVWVTIVHDNNGPDDDDPDP